MHTDCLRIRLGELRERRRCVEHGVGVGEGGFEFAAVLLCHARFDAVQQVKEAVGERAVHPRVAQISETLSPLLVGHRLDVAEIRLARGGERSDHLVATGGQLVGMLLQVDEQTPGLGGGILDLVDVCVQMRQTGGHAAAFLAGRHPAFSQRGKHVTVLGVRVDAGRCHEEVLDLVAGVRFLRGHHRRAHEHAVHRHERHAVALAPLAADVVRGTFGRADAAAGDEHDVAVVAHLRVGADEQVIEAFP